MLFEILTVINTACTIFVLTTVKFNYHMSIRKTTSFYMKKLLCYDITLWKRTSYGSNGITSIRIPVCNIGRAEIQDEIFGMMKMSDQAKTQKLRAMFSWLKTDDEVKQFCKDYRSVYPDLVDRLVNQRKLKESHLC